MEIVKTYVFEVDLFRWRAMGVALVESQIEAHVILGSFEGQNSFWNANACCRMYLGRHVHLSGDGSSFII